jgi:hypothetical protein
VFSESSRPVGNRSPSKRLAKAFASSGFGSLQFGRQIETEAAPIRYVAELVAADAGQ